MNHKSYHVRGTDRSAVSYSSVMKPFKEGEQSAERQIRTVVNLHMHLLCVERNLPYLPSP